VDLSLLNLELAFHCNFYTDLYFLVATGLCLKEKFKTHPCSLCLQKILVLFFIIAAIQLHKLISQEIVPLVFNCCVASDNVTNAILFVHPSGEMWKSIAIKTPSAYSSGTAASYGNVKI